MFDRYGIKLGWLAVLLGVMSVFIIIIILSVGAVVYNVTGAKECEAKWGNRAKWTYWSACLVETNKGYLPEGAVFGVDVGVQIK